MELTFIMGIAFMLGLPLLIAAIVLTVLWADRKKPGGSAPQDAAVRKSLGEVIKCHRTRCKLTQEALAESLGVSRQAVSKWESGASDPSTANLIALAKLFGVSVDELLKDVE